MHIEGFISTSFFRTSPCQTGYRSKTIKFNLQHIQAQFSYNITYQVTPSRQEFAIHYQSGKINQTDFPSLWRTPLETLHED